MVCYLLVWAFENAFMTGYVLMYCSGTGKLVLYHKNVNRYVFAFMAVSFVFNYLMQ